MVNTHETVASIGLDNSYDALPPGRSVACNVTVTAGPGGHHVTVSGGDAQPGPGCPVTECLPRHSVLQVTVTVSHSQVELVT